MTLHRRTFLMSGAAAIGVLGTSTMMPFRARAGGHGDMYKTANGQIEIIPKDHASFVMQTPAGTIYVDPVGGADLYDGEADADMIMVTHHHGDHYDEETLLGLIKDNTQVLVNPEVMGKLSEPLKAKATAISNGERMMMGEVSVEAIPAYNLTEDRLKFHPKGRDNGLVLTIDGTRVYISGDTEDIPEMRALENIDIAFVCMNLPYTMEVEKAADAVREFKPGVVYPYHYRDSDPEAFATLVGDASQVVQGAWYDAPTQS